MFYASPAQSASNTTVSGECTGEESLFFACENIASIGSTRLEPIIKAPGVISVVSSATIASMPARTLIDVLRIMPGITVRYDNIGKYHLGIRGIDDSTNILVMIDGRRFNEVYSGRPLFDLPVDGIDRIEIIRGPGSALYGTGAMAGAINVIMKKEEGLKVKAGGGTYNTKKANITFGTVTEKIKFYGFAELYDTAGGNTTIEYDELSTIGHNSYSTTPHKINDSKNKNQVALRLDAYGFSVGLDYYKEKRGPNYALHQVMSTESSLSNDYLALDIKKSFEMAGENKIHLDLFANRWSIDNKIQLFPSGYVDQRDLDNDGSVESFPDGQWLRSSYQSITYGSDVYLEQKTAYNHDIIIGVTAEQIARINTDITTNYQGYSRVNALPKTAFANWNNYDLQNRERSVMALYLQDTWNLEELLPASIVYGARYDNYSDFGGTLNPRLAVAWFPTNGYSAKVQYGTAFRAPSFEELYDDTDLDKEGNSDLKPEKIETIEASIRKDLGKNGYIGLSVYREIKRDSIDTLESVTQTKASYYYNAGDIETVGWTLESRYDIDSSYGFFNASMFNSRHNQSGTWLTYIPQFNVKAGISVALPHKSRATINWIWSDSAASNKRTVAERLGFNNTTVGSYSLINASYSVKDLFMKGILLKISAFNILGVDYRDMYNNTRDTTVAGTNDGGRPLAIFPPSSQRAFLLEISKNI